MLEEESLSQSTISETHISIHSDLISYSHDILPQHVLLKKTKQKRAKRFGLNLSSLLLDINDIFNHEHLTDYVN